MYDLSPGITMRSTIPAYSYRHGLNFIPGIVKTRIDCYSGISNPSLIVMAPGVLQLFLIEDGYHTRFGRQPTSDIRWVMLCLSECTYGCMCACLLIGTLGL